MPQRGSIVTDSDELAQLLAQRKATSGTDRAAVDAAIHARFGRMQAIMFTDLVGFSRLVEAFGILHFLQLIHESESLFLPLIQQHGGSLSDLGLWSRLDSHQCKPPPAMPCHSRASWSFQHHVLRQVTINSGHPPEVPGLGMREQP